MGKLFKWKKIRKEVIICDNKKHYGEIFKITLPTGESYETFLADNIFSKCSNFFYTTLPYTVPKDHVWLQGDNQNVSLDSFIFGSVHISSIEGVVNYVIKH